ncbi:MAG: hypothetical protein AEth_00501 [Candidatus Argoarchaeum ethanivorans]|uniref:Uncharacterized protein n=1 Tax=Candidatus Argoarchaeum ethanivorans TaxID=2608793 RepID=A0A8B3S6Q6_9EURY|nr:MAG: hypothetical protein AEth_00501 [Candidatus Argoarchaeum ethanivorans]
MDMKLIIKRLAFAKYLIERGNQESVNSEPLSFIALLHYHDALELSFDLVLEDKGINTKDLGFMQYFERVNGWLRNNGKNEISLKPSLVRLKNRRVNLKHGGLFPSKMDIEESKFTANNTFEEICKNVYGLNAQKISLVELIENQRVNAFIKEAINSYDSDQRKSIEKISFSFEFLLRDYEQSKSDLFLKSPFYFGRNMTFLNSFHMGLNHRDKLSEFVDSVKESIEAMQKAVKILAFGLDYKKYIKFRLLIPEPIWCIGNDMPKVSLGQNTKISKEDFNFCINYLVECSLKLQEFDFEISKKENV